MELSAILEKALDRPRALSLEELQLLIEARDPQSVKEIRSAAYQLKNRYIGKDVSIRGIIELGNICSKDCNYCGIRSSNKKIERYSLTAEEVEKLAKLNAELGYASLVLQSGEIEGEAHTAFIEECLKRIAPLNLGVTLSLGEQTEEVYKRWKDAGASRYLLRIETSNKELYKTLHPPTHSWERRVECLRALGRCGYQVGTGVMSALPGQTAKDLAQDIIFFGEIDADMIGMGPYIPHPDTPLGKIAPPIDKAQRLHLGLNMIAATRLYLHDVNIAATTALQALAEDGREQGILAGANVIMPNITFANLRRNYQLYQGKPAQDENDKLTRMALEQSLAKIGEKIIYGKRGDSLHYFKKQNSGLHP